MATLPPDARAPAPICLTMGSTEKKPPPASWDQAREFIAGPTRPPGHFSVTFFTSSSTGIEGSPVVLHPNHAARACMPLRFFRCCMSW
jgi:hypothetical protein